MEFQQVDNWGAISGLTRNRKEVSQLVNLGAMDPLGKKRVHTDLLGNPFPCLGSRVNIRSNNQRASRLVRENSEVGGLAKKVKIKSRIAEVRSGGATGITPRERAASPGSMGRSDSAPRVRRICTIWPRRSSLASRDLLLARRGSEIYSPLLNKQQDANNVRQAHTGKTTRKGEWGPNTAQ